MTNKQRKECVALHRSGAKTEAQLAVRYGVCKQTIQRVLKAADSQKISKGGNQNGLET